MVVEKLFGNKVIGIKQSKKAIENGDGNILYVANDATESLVKPLKTLANEHGVEIKYVDTMKKLGIMCEIDVKASVALILK